MLECVLNLSEGRDLVAVERIASAAGDQLLDVHSDPWHNRSVLTIAGPDVLEAAMAVTRAAVSTIDLRGHDGVHPRFGVVDVVPFVPFEPGHLDPLPLGEALAARESFCRWLSSELELAAYTYDPDRPLPAVRRAARLGEPPDWEPPDGTPPDGVRAPGIAQQRAGVVCVGARQVLVAWNLMLAEGSPRRASEIASQIRSATVRALGFDIGGRGQVSCNLVDPATTGPDDVYDLVSAQERVDRCELVGLAPAALLDRLPPQRWDELGLGAGATIEARLA